MNLGIQTAIGRERGSSNFKVSFFEIEHNNSFILMCRLSSDHPKDSPQIEHNNSFILMYRLSSDRLKNSPLRVQSLRQKIPTLKYDRGP